MPGTYLEKNNPENWKMINEKCGNLFRQGPVGPEDNFYFYIGKEVIYVFAEEDISEDFPKGFGTYPIDPDSEEDSEDLTEEAGTLEEANAYIAEREKA